MKITTDSKEAPANDGGSKKSLRDIVAILIFVLLIVLAFTTDWQKSPKQLRHTTPPSDCNAARIVVEGVTLRIRMMSTFDSEVTQSCENFMGKGWAFMVLFIDASKATDKFEWRCWKNNVFVTLEDGTESKSIDISDMEGFYQWDYKEFFACSKTVYPGKKDLHYLAFYPSFNWWEISELTFQTGLFGTGNMTAQWVRR